MARGKARYKGHGAGDLISDFSGSLKKKLRAYYPGQEQPAGAEGRDDDDEDVVLTDEEKEQAAQEAAAGFSAGFAKVAGKRQGTTTDKSGDEQDSSFEHPADEFVAHVLAEAWWAKATLHWNKYSNTKNDTNAELGDLLKRTQELIYRLRKLSPDADRLLGVNADPLGTADKLQALMPFVKKARSSINKLPKAKTPAQRDRAIALEMSIRVLRVLKGYGIEPLATAGNDVSGKTSPAIQILKAIGDDIGLVFAPTTWRDILRDAKPRIDPK